MILGCKTVFHLFAIFIIYTNFPLQTLLVIFGFLNSCCEMNLCFINITRLIQASGMNETFVYYLLNVIFSANFKMLARETHYRDKHFLFSKFNSS